jgi:homocysteine S-methyltransferase
MLDAIEKMTAYTSKPLSAMPSAGLPGAECSPGYLAQYARRFARVGAQIVGGCCGTTPAHIRAIRDEVDSGRPGPLPHGHGSEAPPPNLDPAPNPAVIALAEKSALGAKLAAGQFVTLAEIYAPRGADASREIEDAKLYQAANIDAVVVGDGPGARLSAPVTAQLIQQQAGMETVLQLSGRGRSIATIQGELMSAHAVGVRNILCTGADAAVVASIANNLNQGLDAGGNPIGSRTALVLGVEVNASSFQQLDTAVRAGADYLLAQPVFDLDVFEAFLKHAEQYRLPVVAGIRLLTSLRDGEYVMNELHVPVPAAYMARLSVSPDGVAIALEIVERVRPMVAGVMLSAPSAGRGMVIQVAQAMGPR